MQSRESPDRVLPFFDHGLVTIHLELGPNVGTIKLRLNQT